MATYGGRLYWNPRVTFITSDGKEVKVPVEIARKFGRVSDFYDRPGVENAAPFPLPNVESDTLAAIVEYEKGISKLDWTWFIYSRWEREESKKRKEMEEFKDSFFARLSVEEIIKVLTAAIDLDIKELLDSVMPRLCAKLETDGGSSSSNPRRMVLFLTSDCKKYKVPVAVARKFGGVSDLYGGDLDRPEVENSAPFPLPNVESNILNDIVYYDTAIFKFDSASEAVLKREESVDLPFIYEMLERSKRQFKNDFFARRSNEEIIKMFKAAVVLEFKDLLDFLIPIFRKRFGPEDDYGVQEVDATILPRRAGASRNCLDAKMATYGGSSSSSDPMRKVTFKTSDGKEVKVSEKIARKFGTLTNLCDGDLDRLEVENPGPFPLSKVDSFILHRIVDYEARMIAFNFIYEALEREELFKLPSIYEAMEKQRQEFKDEYFGCLSDKTIVEVVKAAVELDIKELLDSAMPRFRKRFGLGNDKGVDFVFTDEMGEILCRRAASSRKRSYATIPTYEESSATIPTYEESSDPNPTRMVKFDTSDGVKVEVPLAITVMFGTVMLFVVGALDDTELFNVVWPLPNVSSYILHIVVSACKKLLELHPKYDVLEEVRQEFFDQYGDGTIIELVKAANYLGIQELLDFVMPSFRKRFGLGDDKDVEFVYTDEAEAILLRSAASTSEGASS